MIADLVTRWAALNGLAVTDQPFGLHQLADNPPAGADQTPNPNAENAVHLVDAEGKPAAIVFVSWGGQWMRELADVVRWMRLSAFAPPAPAEEGERLFLVVGRPDAPEPRWLPERR